jgi:hypothetical protein
MTDYSELIRKARAVPGPTLLLSYPAQTTPDPLSNALADAIEELQNRVTFEAAANLATAKLNANLLKRIAELEAALKDATVHLVAAVSLLESGGKKAAPSNKMFEQMLVDYKNGVERARAALKGERG